MLKRITKALRTYLISGLLIWLPIWATIVVFKFMIGLFDNTVLLLPRGFRPDELLGYHIPGLGFVVAIIIMLITGVFVTNLLGRQLESIWDRLVAKIPLVSSVHAGVKKVLVTLFSNKEESFRKVLLVEYPRRGLWSIAFQASDAPKRVENHVGKQMVTIFIPTTPNPTSGFLMMVPKEDVFELDISVDAGLKLVISLGVVKPD